jgi:uncharacterized protein with von Willebrand factor type A (vWA) domain
MLRTPAPEAQDHGRLAENVLHFSRLLRQAGLPLGTDRPLLALEALAVAGIPSRGELRSVLEACLIDRIEHRALFRQAFEFFWRDPTRLGEPHAALPLPHVPARRAPPGRAVSRRLAAALWPKRSEMRPGPQPPGPQGLEVAPSVSDRERLHRADFETLSAAEWAAATAAVAALAPLLARTPSRRDRPAASGSRLDLKRLLRESARHGGESATLPRRSRRLRPARIVALIDVSGSMSRYSRMFLHFLHALANPRGRSVHLGGLRSAAFVFGTRLTPVTRDLAARDADEAVARVSRRVEDWSGGTRIGACLGEFNRSWAKRLPLSSSTVLLVTDGLERTDSTRLELEAARLARSCRRLIWLNPLLRYDGFEPKARGMRALLPHADLFLPIHNLESLERLAAALAEGAARMPRPRGRETKTWR